jgi:hypothetical protein
MANWLYWPPVRHGVPLYQRTKEIQMKRLQATVAYSVVAIMVGALPFHAPLAGGDPFVSIGFEL